MVRQIENGMDTDQVQCRFFLRRRGRVMIVNMSDMLDSNMVHTAYPPSIGDQVWLPMTSDPADDLLVRVVRREFTFPTYRTPAWPEYGPRPVKGLTLNLLVEPAVDAPVEALPRSREDEPGRARHRWPLLLARVRRMLSRA